MDETLTASIGDLTGLTTDRLQELTEEVTSPTGIPSRPLLGVLPLRRLIPQDVHSVMDYAGGLGLVLAGTFFAKGAVRTAGLVLGSAMIGTSLVTDYRLSLAKLVPIEVHEVADYATGLSAMLVPFVAPRRRRKGVSLGAWLQFAVGATTVVASLFTDYRASRGVGR